MHFQRLLLLRLGRQHRTTHLAERHLQSSLRSLVARDCLPASNPRIVLGIVHDSHPQGIPECDILRIANDLVLPEINGSPRRSSVRSDHRLPELTVADWIHRLSQHVACPFSIWCSVGVASACLNDSFEQQNLNANLPQTHAFLRQAIVGKSEKGPSQQTLEKKLKDLEARPKKLLPTWWTEVAATLIRLKQTERAITLLEEALPKFPGEYAIHSTLGTAYHLLGRLKEAEVQIAAGLRINPQGHNNREIYHLALLQYLNAPAEWRATHVLLDEWTPVFFAMKDANELDEELLGRQLLPKGSLPAYRQTQTLATSPRQEIGVAYMLSLNPKEPSCFIMAGILAAKANDAASARMAFQSALRLGATQVEDIKAWLDFVKNIEPPAAIPRIYSPHEVRKKYLLTFTVIAFGMFLGLWWLRRNLVG